MSRRTGIPSGDYGQHSLRITSAPTSEVEAHPIACYRPPVTSASEIPYEISVTASF